MKKNKLTAILLYLPFLICFILFWFMPLLYGVWISLHDWTLHRGNEGFVGFRNYVSILNPATIFGDLFYQGLGNTLTFVLISVLPLIVISLGLALLINNLPPKVKPLFRTIFFISYSISITSVSAIFLWLFNGNGGFINNVLGKSIHWLTEQPYAWITILVTTVWWTIGFNMILFINALDEVDYALYEAADLDGANAFKKFQYITLPSIKSVLLFVTITTVIASFNLYGQTLLITAGGPEQSTNTLIMNIQQTVFSQNNLGVGSAMAITMGLIMMMITGIQYFYTYRKEL